MRYACHQEPHKTSVTRQILSLVLKVASLTYLSWRLPRNQGLLILTASHCVAKLKLFLQWRGSARVVLLEWVTVSVLWCGRQQMTVVGSCIGKVNCKRRCFQTAARQMSQWRHSRSVELEPKGLIVGHSWSACLNSVKCPRQTEATHSLCVTHCPPDKTIFTRLSFRSYLWFKIIKFVNVFSNREKISVVLASEMLVPNFEFSENI